VPWRKATRRTRATTAAACVDDRNATPFGAFLRAADAMLTFR
jgi:hypothetical protein